MSNNDPENLQDELQRLRAENERLKKGAPRAMSLKVSEKGGMSVHRHYQG